MRHCACALTDFHAASLLPLWWRMKRRNSRSVAPFCSHVVLATLPEASSLAKVWRKYTMPSSSFLVARTPFHSRFDEGTQTAPAPAPPPAVALAPRTCSHGLNSCTDLNKAASHARRATTSPRNLDPTRDSCSSIDGAWFA